MPCEESRVMDKEEMKSSHAWLARHGMRYGFAGSEYQGWTEWMAIEQKVPRLLYERPFSWQCRAFLGKWMVAHGRMTEGIRVLHSVVDAPEEIEPSYMEEGEELAWCLKELGLACWLTERDAGTALKHLEKALRTLEAVAGELNHLSRGEVWGSWLMLMEEAGRSGEAAESAGRVLRDAGQDKPGRSRSYVFYACRYEAWRAMVKGDETQAARYIQRGLKVYAEPADAEEAELFLQNGQLGAAWQECDRLGREPGLVWDDDQRPRNRRQKWLSIISSACEALSMKRKGGVLVDDGAV